MKRFLMAGLAGMLAAAGGCGTMENLRGSQEQGGPRAYGGVAADLRACREIPQETTELDWAPGMGFIAAHSQAVRFCLRVIDLPISFAGDTLTLPVVLFTEPASGRPRADGEETAEERPARED